MADIVPFGKYKNQPVEVLAQDKEYCEWLSGQGWVAQRYPGIHTLIINNFAEPSETPEHNALQLRFLDDALQLKVTLCLALFKHPMLHRFKPGCYVPMIGCCTEPTFEVTGIDVQWEIDLWYPEFERTIRYKGDGTDIGSQRYFWMQWGCGIAVECKPSLGDDYPAVLRFMHALPDNKWKVVIVENYSFRGGTVEQVRKLFQSSGILLLDMAGLEALPAVNYVAREDLPPAQDYLHPNRTKRNI
jgi:hypothetical protein